MHDAAQLARHVDAVQHPLVRDATHLVHLVDRVRQVGRQDANHHCLDAQHRFARRDRHRQLNLFLQLGVLVVNRCEGERLAAQQARRKLKIQGEHGREVAASRRVPAGHGHADRDVVQGVRDQHVHRDAASFRHVQLGRREADDHGAQAPTRRGVLAQEVEGVLGVDVPLRLALVPVGASLADVGFAHERVFRHGPFTHRPSPLRVFADHAHHVNDLSILAKHDGVVAVVPRHLAEHLTHVDNGCLRLGVAHDVDAEGGDDSFQVQTLDRLGRPVVVHLHHVRREVNVLAGRVVNLQGLVVARAFNVLRDNQVVAQASHAALQHVDQQVIRGKAVAAKPRCTQHRLPVGCGGRVEAVLGAQTPHVVGACLTKGREIKKRRVRRGQNGVSFVADEERVLTLHRVAEVPKGHQRSVFRRQAHFLVGLSPRRQHRAPVARRNFACLPHQHHWRRGHADATACRLGFDAVKGGPTPSKRQAVGNGVHLKRAVAQPFHVDRAAQKRVQQLARGGVDHRQRQQCALRVGRVGESHDRWAQIRAIRRLRVVRLERPSFARKHVGGPGAQRLHHKRLVQWLPAVRHPRQAVGARIGLVARFGNGSCGARKNGVHQGRHLGVRHAGVSVKHGVQHALEGRGFVHHKRGGRTFC